MAKIISVFNQKGGVAKTTSALNISACLAMEGKKVLLIDNDPQGNASESLELCDSEKTIYDILINEMNINEVVIKTEIENLYIIPANIDHAESELELINVMMREMVLTKAIEKLNTEFDYIIIDCPPSLGLLSLNSLASSNHVVIPVKVGRYAMRGLKNLSSTVNKVKEHLNKNLSITGIVMTQDDPNTNISKLVKSKLQEQLGDMLFETIIPRAVKVIESEFFESRPIVIFDPSSKVSIEYVKLTKEVVSRVG